MLLPEDGQLGPKHVGVFKKKLVLTKVIVFKVLRC
jgi:hypothetical protein